MKRTTTRVLGLLLTLCLIVGLLPIMAFAEESMSGTCGAEGNETSVTWALTQNNGDSENPTYTLTISGNGAMADYTENEGLTARPWHSVSKQITKVVIEDGITKIGNSAFQKFSALTDIVWPATQCEIGFVAFSGCESLKSVDIPSNMSIYNQGAGNECWTFASCTSLESVIVAQDVYSRQFFDCPNIKSFTVKPDCGVKRVGYYVLSASPQNVKVSIPEGVEEFGLFVYGDYTGISFDIPNTVKKFLSYAFKNATIAGLFIPESVTEWKNNACLSVSNSDGVLYFQSAASFNSCIALVNAGDAPSKANQIYAITNGGTYAPGTVFEAGKLYTPTKEDYIFGGWYTKNGTGSDDWGQKLDSTSGLTASATSRYYAKWVNEITFDANGGNGAMTTQEIAEGATSATLTQNRFTKTGYTFSGWNTKADGSGSSYADQGAAPTTSTTLYAQWTPNTYTISFNGGDGATGTTTSVAATYDTPIALPANSFSKDNCTFAGWSKTEGGTTIDFSDGAQAKNLTAEDHGTVTLYAVWTTKTVLAPDVSAQTKTYNGAEQALTLGEGYTISYLQNGETATPKDAGTYDVVISADETNDTAAYHNTVYGGLVIAPAPLTITPKNKTAYVGDTLPTLGENDYTVTGLVGSDTLTKAPTLAYDGTPDMNTANTYVIKASGAEVGANYTITYVDGTLTVRARSGGGSGSSGNVSGSGDDVRVSASGGSVSAALMEKAVNRADRGGTITIDATRSASVSLPSGGLQAAADNRNGLTVELKNGKVTLSSDALSAVAEQAGTTVTLTVAPVEASGLNSRQQAAAGSAPVFDLTIKSGSKVISDFDGGLATVSIPYELPAGHDPAGVVVWFMDDDGNITPCETMYDLRSEAVIFTTRHFSKYVIGYEEPMDFTDVPADAYYAEAVAWAVKNGITSGTSATTFSPDASCTRAQMVTFLWRAAGCPAPKSTVNSFTDVQSGMYYSEAVLWAVEQGITNGTSVTTFSPDDTVTRSQTVTFLYRAAGSPAVSGNSFADVASDSYYANAVAWAAAKGITNGTGGNRFSPDEDCTRGQTVTFLYRDMA